MTNRPANGLFLGSAQKHLFLRPNLRPPRRRAQGCSRMAEGHREAARSVLDQTEHAGTIVSREGDNLSVTSSANSTYGMKIMVATISMRSESAGPDSTAAFTTRRSKPNWSCSAPTNASILSGEASAPTTVGCELTRSVGGGNDRLAAHDPRRLGNEDEFGSGSIETALDDFRRDVDVQAEGIAVQRGVAGDEPDRHTGKQNES